jgi:hypothetical protein
MLSRMLPFVIGIVLSSEIRLALLYIDNQVSLQELLVNIGLAAFVILLWWRVLPAVKKWADD